MDSNFYIIVLYMKRLTPHTNNKRILSYPIYFWETDCVARRLVLRDVWYIRKAFRQPGDADARDSAQHTGLWKASLASLRRHLACCRNTQRVCRNTQRVASLNVTQYSCLCINTKDMYNVRIFYIVSKIVFFCF